MPRILGIQVAPRRVASRVVIGAVGLLVAACSEPTVANPRAVPSRPSFNTTASPDVYAYVTEAHGTVAVIRTSDAATIANIAVDGEPLTVAFTPDAAYAYVPVIKSGAGAVDVIRTSDNAVVKSIAVGNSPHGVAVSHDGSAAYVTNLTDNTVSVIRTSDNTVVATVGVCTRPEGIAVTPDGAAVYVACNNGTNTVQGNVAVIRTSDRSVTTLQMGMSPDGTEGNSPHEVAITPDGAYAYVSNDNSNGSVSVIRTSDKTIVKNIATSGNFPERLAISPDGGTVYVPILFGSSSGSGNLDIIATATNSVTSTIAVPNSGIAAAFTPDGATAYVTSNNSEVAVIATSTHTVTQTLTLPDLVLSVGITPAAISLDLGQELTDLQDTLAGLGLGGGLTTSLQAKLSAVLAALNGGNTPLACSDLQDFINQVKAQSGKKISQADATTLINEAMSLQAQLGC